MSKIKLSAELIPSEGCERRICSRPLSLAYRWSSSMSLHLTILLCPNFPPLYWIRETRVWANSGRWQRTGKPGAVQSMGAQRVGHDWETELNWKCGENSNCIAQDPGKKKKKPSSSITKDLRDRPDSCPQRLWRSKTLWPNTAPEMALVKHRWEAHVQRKDI